jgi:hypothetical protein
MTIGSDKHSIVYFNSIEKAIHAADEYAKNLPEKHNPTLDALSKEIQQEIHDTYYLAEFIRKGVAYHVGYLPSYIRTSIEKCYRNHDISILFCTSTLIEGVNLPADNLFIMSYKNGLSNMSHVDFRNLLGRVGRIGFNLYGNVFIMHYDTSLSTKKYHELIEKDVPEQKISLASSLTKTQKQIIIDTLLNGKTDFVKYPEAQSQEAYSLMRKFGLILLNDITNNHNGVVRQEFKDYLTPTKEATIKSLFITDKNHTKPDDDINISVDQTENLYMAVKKGMHYPPKKSIDKFDHGSVVQFLEKLCNIYNWKKYECYKKGLIPPNGSTRVFSYYATILIQWMEGNGLNNIIKKAIEYKETHSDSTVYINGEYLPYTGSRFHKNAVIAETLSIIDNIILFKLANYFLRFSTEYKIQHNVDNFENDWYEYVEYGSTNRLTIFLQRNGFSREVSTYIKQHQDKYVTTTSDGIKLRLEILQCPNEAVKLEVTDIQYNMPEIFINA